jgi:hypothetical protein
MVNLLRVAVRAAFLHSFLTVSPPSALLPCYERLLGFLGSRVAVGAGQNAISVV